MTPKEILVAARALISEPEHWTQGAYARDIDGEDENPCDQRAICFCAVGAIYKSDASEHYTVYARILLSRAMGGPVISFNDTHTHAEVLAAFDRAIASFGDAP